MDRVLDWTSLNASLMGIKGLTQSLPVVLAVLMRDASQVFKRIENRNNYSPVISRWG
jgi:hypothetical protein